MFAHKVLFRKGCLRSSGALMASEAGSNNEFPGEFRFRTINEADAQVIAAWMYPDEYSFYDFMSDPDDLAELLDPIARADEYFAVDNSEGALIGFFQYKRPHGTSIGIGLGLHPDWTGRGFGRRFLEAGLDYGRRSFSPEQYTLSVATFNQRAITVYERAGFAIVRTFNHRTCGREWEFVEMQRPA
jgi:[ribosomal protein S18]-alanine N-acetyltransferase